MARNYRTYRLTDGAHGRPFRCGTTYCVGTRISARVKIAKRRRHSRLDCRNWRDRAHHGLTVTRFGKPILNHLKHKRK